MDESKRDFLKKAGISIAGFGVLGAATSAVGRAIKAERNPNALLAQRWAMVIDTKKCAENKGCTKCVDACHLSHNVPYIKKADGSPDPKNEVKWLWKETYEHVFPTQIHEFTPEELLERPTLVACNHCKNPPCVRVCPTQATWKRADGIVMMDMHRCVGCRYCLVACPYGSRSFNFVDPVPHIPKETFNHEYPTRMKGVAEKCDFCTERLARGEEPACVEACKKKGVGALVFGDLKDESSPVAEKVAEYDTLRRKPSLGTQPHVFYKV